MENEYKLCVIFDGSLEVLVTASNGLVRSSPVFHAIDSARLWIERDKARCAAAENLPALRTEHAAQRAREMAH
jgi:hypothetical protein